MTTDHKARALAVLSDEPCIGTRESPEAFACRIAVAAIRSVAEGGEAVGGRVCGYTPGENKVVVQVDCGPLPEWMELGERVYVSTAPQPPIDLEQFREAVELLRVNCMVDLAGAQLTGIAPNKMHDDLAEADRLLALIDAHKRVGK